MLLQTQSQWTLIGTTLRWEFKRSRKREGQAGMWFFTGLHEAHPGIHAGSLTAKQSPAGPSQVNTNTTGSPKTWSWLLTCPCPDCSLISWTSGVSGCIPSSFSGGTFPALGPDSQLENLAKATVSFVRWPVQRSAPCSSVPLLGSPFSQGAGSQSLFHPAVGPRLIAWHTLLFSTLELVFVGLLSPLWTRSLCRVKTRLRHWPGCL